MDKIAMLFKPSRTACTFAFADLYGKESDAEETPPGEALYTVEQVGRILKFAPGTVRRMIDEGELKAIKIRGQWRIKREDLQDYIDRKS